MVAIKPITQDSVVAFKATRLKALQDSPLAFGSTFANESQLSDSEWIARVDKWCSDLAKGFLAWDGQEPCGIVASLLDRNDPSMAHLTSMWVAPSHRKNGVGQSLVAEVVHWAQLQQARMIRLTVTSNNGRAIVFYERLGFVRTGRTEPYPNDPSLVEFEMVRVIQ